MKAAAQRTGGAGSGFMRALAVLGIVALLAAPTAYFHFYWQQVEGEMLDRVQADAQFLAVGVRHHADDANNDTATVPARASSAPRADTALAIRQLMHRLPVPEFEGRRVLRDATGRVLAQTGAPLPGPVFSVTVPWRDATGAMGELEMTRSSRPVLWHMLGVGSLVLVLGALIALVTVQGARRSRGRPEGFGDRDGATGVLARQGVLARDAFMDSVREAIERSGRDGTECTLFHLDLDHFKMINGAVGQTYADLLLEQVARVVRRRIDEMAEQVGLPPVVMGAPGGDVLLLLVEALPKSAQVTEAFARGVLDALGSTFEVGPYQLYLTASVGVSHRAGRALSAEKLVREAELAKIFAKNQGCGSYAIHDQNMDAEAEQRSEMGQALRQALLNDEFVLYYQPKVHMVTGAVTGVEALLRWQPEGKPLLMPDRFIPVLEETGLIVQAGAWVLQEACRQLMVWRSHGMPPIGVAVNVSARQLQSPGFVELVERVLKETRLEPRWLELELTETIFVDNASDNVRVLRRLADLGVSLAIDDFGTGHSSLSYLSNFSPRTLKIDRSFLSEAEDGSDNVVIARAIIALGHGMGLNVVAEGVETEAQADFLRGYGCDQMQGFLLSRPQPAERMEQWLRARIQSQQSLEEARRAAVF